MESLFTFIICAIILVAGFVVLRSLFSGKGVFGRKKNNVYETTPVVEKVEKSSSTSSTDWRIEVINTDGSKIVLYPPVQLPKN